MKIWILILRVTLNFLLFVVLCEVFVALVKTVAGLPLVQRVRESIPGEVEHFIMDGLGGVEIYNF